MLKTCSRAADIFQARGDTRGRIPSAATRTGTSAASGPRTVAGIAAHSLIHVDAVVEIHEVGQLVDARPFERTPGAKTFADRLEVRCVGPDLAWQLIQVLVGGIPAKLDCSTEVWQ